MDWLFLASSPAFRWQNGGQRIRSRRGNGIGLSRIDTRSRRAGVWVSYSHWKRRPPQFPQARGGGPGQGKLGKLGGERERCSHSCPFDPAIRPRPRRPRGSSYQPISSQVHICNIEMAASKHDLEAARTWQRGRHVALCDLGAATAFPCFKGTFYPARNRTRC